MNTLQTQVNVFADAKDAEMWRASQTPEKHLHYFSCSLENPNHVHRSCSLAGVIYVTLQAYNATWSNFTGPKYEGSHLASKSLCAILSSPLLKTLSSLLLVALLKWLQKK